jgi:two-component system alkaline phosphatase synthesis response regulator PhoP
MATILIVDDEQDILDMIEYNLRKDGHNVRMAHNGREALSKLTPVPDLIVLDIMMPEMNGMELCRHLKDNESTAGIPVLFLTAKAGETDEVSGLDIGADDYLQKPVSIAVLQARIRAALRRRALTSPGDSRIELLDGRVVIDKSSFAVQHGGSEHRLARKVFLLLWELALNNGRVLTREQLLNRIWGDDTVVGDRTLDVHIRRIREQLGEFGGIIETVKGIGYRLNAGDYY